jgi:RNA polymerase sigma-70 factor (ECF subfamily)
VLRPRPLQPARLGDDLDRLYRAALALCGSREDAEDLVQETFARVLARPRFLRKGSELAYLLGALHHTFVSQRRAAGRRPRTSPLDAGLEPADERRATDPVQAAEMDLLYTSIAALPEEFRVVLVAVDIVGLSYGEVARLFRVPEATVASRLFRARRRAAAALVGDGAAGPPRSEGEQGAPGHAYP